MDANATRKAAGGRGVGKVAGMVAEQLAEHGGEVTLYQ